MSADPKGALRWRVPPGRLAHIGEHADATLSTEPRMRYLRQSFWVLAALLLVLIAAKADETEDLLGAVLIVLASLFPVYWWIREGVKSLPILPAVALVHIVYFAFPLVSDHPELAVYEPGERLAAALTVLLFLLAATAGSALTSRSIETRESAADREGGRVEGVIAVGLGAGVLFQYLTLAGYLAFLGEWYGVARAFVWNLLFAVTFVVGVLKGRDALRSGFALACFSLVVLNVLASWMSLFLVHGVVLWSLFMVGYVLGARTIPLKSVTAMFLLAMVLHAGKADMRERYWMEDGQTNQAAATALPGRMLEWVDTGLTNLAGGSSGSASILERASLMQMLMRARHLSPDAVPFLGGETYAQIPHMLVPRVLDPDKPASQAGMDMLNVHYGVLTIEDVKRTAVGWGLMSEAYANFGLPGVLACGALLGLFIGGVTRWARSSPPLSAPTMFGVIVTGVSVSLEADAASYITSLFQAAIVVLVLTRVIHASSRTP